MGRKAQPPKPEWTGKFWRLRFTHEGRRHDFKNTTIPEKDTGRANRWMAERLDYVYSGRWKDEQTEGKDPSASLKEVAATYLHEKAGGEITPRTAKLYKGHMRRFLKRWAKLSDVTRGALASYQSERLKAVQWPTVRKELSTLRQVLRFAEVHGYIASLPKFPEKPAKSTGTKHKNAPSGFTSGFTADMTLAIIRALPVLSKASKVDGQRWPLRAQYELQHETGLRPGLIKAIRYGKHWRKGQTFLHITADIDKNRWERDVPLTPAAVAALASVEPKADGRMFSGDDRRGALRSAARRAGLPEHIASRVHPYDLRHARTTEWVNATNQPLGVGYLVGHKQVTTTNRYSHADKRQGEEVIRLSARNSGAESGGGNKTSEAGSCDPAPLAAVFSCAKERTRTSTGVNPLAPQGTNNDGNSGISAGAVGARGRLEAPEGNDSGGIPQNRPGVRRAFGAGGRASAGVLASLPVAGLAQAAARMGVAP
jgi:integrase